MLIHLLSLTDASERWPLRIINNRDCWNVYHFLCWNWLQSLIMKSEITKSFLVQIFLLENHKKEIFNNDQIYEVFYKIGVLKNLAKFPWKHLHWSLCLSKVTGLGPATLLEKRLQHSCFPVNFAKVLRESFL